jgi:hypothetical protein
VARAASIPLDEPTRITDVRLHFSEPAPAITVTRAEYDAAMAALAGIVDIAPGREEEGWRRFAWVRSTYEPALRAMAGLTFAYAAPWTTDRPAVVGEPRFLSRRQLQVDWDANVPAPPAVPTGG